LSISLSEEVWNLLPPVGENRSAYIEELIRRDNEQYDDPSTYRKMLRLRESIETAIRDREDAEARMIEFQEKLDQLESEAGNRKELKQPDIEAARDQVLAWAKKNKATEKDIRGWFEARTDKRIDCGFKSPKEAVDWVRQKMAG